MTTHPHTDGSTENGCIGYRLHRARAWNALKRPMAPFGVPEIFRHLPLNA